MNSQAFQQYVAMPHAVSLTAVSLAIRVLVPLRVYADTLLFKGVIPFRHPDGRLDARTVTSTAPRVDFLGPDAAPEFARQYRVRNGLVADGKPQLLRFYPAAGDRPQPVRVTERSIGKARWYEVETFHANVSQWIDRTSCVTGIEAFEAAVAQHWLSIDSDESRDEFVRIERRVRPRSMAKMAA